MSSASFNGRPPNGIPDAGGVQRRRRGAARLSCAECRRLKLRCDRKVPCESCVKRGCAAICPDGSLTTGKGNRFVLASTQELHEKISELSLRVRELEDALRTSHSQLSPDVHPLLTDELLRIKAPLERQVSNDRERDLTGIKEEGSQDIVDSFGSLYIQETGKANFYGHTASSWYFLQNEDPEDEVEDRSYEVELPQEILELGSALPTSPLNSPILDETSRVSSLVNYLPDSAHALELRDIYYKRAYWYYEPIGIKQFNDDVFRFFYDGQASPLWQSLDSTAASHRLAVLYMVLAGGALMDPQKSPYNVEAERYHQLARAALFRSSIFDEPTLHAVQALFLISCYLFLSDRHGSPSGARWAILGFAVKLAQSIGLHRDSTRWGAGIDGDGVQIRREVFWELFTCDSWQCLTFGRPPSFALPHVDCKYPYPNEDPTGEKSFAIWKHRFSAECLSVVHDQAFGAKAPSYQTVLQLDRKLRAYPVPAILQIAGFGNSDLQGASGVQDTIALVLQRHVVLAIREMILLYMHRGFFARAIKENAKDPLGSPFGTSVIAAYRSAGSLIALVRNLDAQYPEPAERLWFFWTHLFSCSIVLGSIVTHCPSMSLAPSALLQLDSACELFNKVAIGFRAEKVARIMANLQRKAHNALREFREGKISPNPGNLPYKSYEGSPELPDDDDDELFKLGGKTRLIAKKEASKSPSPFSPALSPNSRNPIIPFPLSDTNMEVHPSVMEYLHSFNYAQPRHGQGVPVTGQDHLAYSSENPSLYEAQHSAVDMSYGQAYHGDGTAPSLHIHSQGPNVMDDGSSPSPSSANSGVVPPIIQTPHPGGVPSHAPSTFFPTYFPVFDYGPAQGRSQYGDPLQSHLGGAELSSYEHEQTPQFGHLGLNGLSDHGLHQNGAHNTFLGGHSRGESMTPELNSQSVWMDIVNQMSGSSQKM